MHQLVGGWAHNICWVCLSFALLHFLCLLWPNCSVVSTKFCETFGAGLRHSSRVARGNSRPACLIFECTIIVCWWKEFILVFSEIDLGRLKVKHPLISVIHEMNSFSPYSQPLSPDPGPEFDPLTNGDSKSGLLAL